MCNLLVEFHDLPKVFNHPGLLESKSREYDVHMRVEFAYKTTFIFVDVMTGLTKTLDVR